MFEGSEKKLMVHQKYFSTYTIKRLIMTILHNLNYSHLIKKLIKILQNPVEIQRDP